MNTMHAAVMAFALALAPLTLAAQGAATSDEAKAKKTETKKAETKKNEAKKTAPKKAAAKPAQPSANPEVTVLKSSQATPLTLRDKDGNVIPTRPEAYDVSSATGKKK
jgi:hypothetical protein